jgi:hypothetical protein
MYYNMDLSMARESHKVEELTAVIHRTGQRIELFGGYTDGAFEETMRIVLHGTVPTELVRGVDYVIEDIDLEDTLLSDIMMHDITWNKSRIIKSFKYTGPVSGPMRISISFQKVFPVRDKVFLESVDNTRITDFSPEILESLVRDNVHLKALISSIEANTLNNKTGALLLEEDPHMKNPMNKRVDEEHTINVPNSKAVVFPHAGSFFADSLVVKMPNLNNRVLKHGEDYVCFGMDVHKTKISSVPQEVNNFILFISPIVDDVTISYHAFGGLPTLEDAKAMNKTIIDIMLHLSKSSYITQDVIGTTPVVSEIVRRLNKMENEMRALSSTAPSYGDATGMGDHRKMRVAAVDNKLHWWTIATMYNVDGSSDIFTAGTFKFRLTTVHTAMQFDATAVVNVNKNRDQLSLEVQSANYDRGYVPFEDYSNVDYAVRPQFRIIWNQNTTNTSGIALQVGLPLRGVAEETIVVEDFSGLQSAWKLRPKGDGTAIDPEDSFVRLPSVDHIWDSSNPDSKVVSKLAPLPEGHLIWAGAVHVNEFNNAYNEQILHNFAEPVNINSFKSAILDFMNEDGIPLQLEINLTHFGDKVYGLATYHYNGQPVNINITFKKGDPIFTVDVMVDVRAGVGSTPLYLRHISVK